MGFHWAKTAIIQIVLYNTETCPGSFNDPLFNFCKNYQLFSFIKRNESKYFLKNYE